MRLARRRTWLHAILALLAPAVASAQAPAARSITGRVVDENGKPVAGAAVGTFASREFIDTAKLLAQPEARTTSDGSYAVTRGERLRRGALVFAAPGRQSCALWINDALAADGGPLGETVLIPGTQLAGRVRDEAGSPLTGVRIRVTSAIADHERQQFRLVAGAVSDRNGIFSMPCVPRTGMRLCAEADGYLTESRLVAHESPIDLSLHEVGIVRGKVVDVGGTPVAGVEVYGVTVETRDSIQPVYSAADGTFAITVPKPGRFRIAAHESTAPHRAFGSGLLRGPGDGVLVTQSPRRAEPPQRTIEVVVVDAASRQPIDEFRLSLQGRGNGFNEQLAMIAHGRSCKTYKGKAGLEVPSAEPLCVVVDAPGHGFEIVPVPVHLEQALCVKLGRAAILTGRILDAETGKPMAGVAARALPLGTSHGGGGRPEDFGPLSDGEGNYRIERLRPGGYRVQAHASGRPASPVVSVTLQAGDDNRLDLTVPKERWLEVEVSGTLPQGPACRLSVDRVRVFHGSESAGFFGHDAPAPAPLAIARTGTYRLGPLDDCACSLEVFVASRTHVGAGTVIPFGAVDPEGGPATIVLPELTGVTSGRVELPSDFPTERVAVLATLVAGERPPPWRTEGPSVAGIDGRGSFAIDLPAGSYCVQLVDLLTGIVFHTEAENVPIDGRAGALTLRPAIHWLEVQCAAQHAGDEVVLQSFDVQLSPSRDGGRAFLGSSNRGNSVDFGRIEYRPGANRQRWLVPAGKIAIQARGCGNAEVDQTEIQIAQSEQRAVLKIPMPSDDELLRRE